MPKQPGKGDAGIPAAIPHVRWYLELHKCVSAADILQVTCLAMPISNVSASGCQYAELICPEYMTPPEASVRIRTLYFSPIRGTAYSLPSF